VLEQRSWRSRQLDPTGEFLPIDRFSTSAVVLGEITTLQHELRDDAMEARTSITESMLTCSQFAEVLGGL
jgi:hypothetical protein